MYSQVSDAKSNFKCISFLQINRHLCYNFKVIYARAAYKS